MSTQPPTFLRPEALPAGTRVGAWRVVEKVGVGGYGAVYRVEDEEHPGVEGALKLALHPDEARAGREVVLLMEKAVHPHVVRVHGCGRWPHPTEGHPFHVMEWVPGAPLDVWTETHNPSFLCLTEAGAKLAGALGELHGRGVLHRDVKPENILLRETDGEPVLVDFGVGHYAGAAPLTPTPLPPGTLHLRSPEAMRFWLERGRDVGARYEAGPADDLYALGVSLYRAVTGHYPVPPELGELLPEAIVHRRLRPPRDFNRRVPRALSDVLLRMLAKAPEERYRTGAEVHAALLAAAAFGRRAPWEASLFEWEEVPGEKEGDAPVRRIRRPAFPTRPVTPAPPRVRLLPGGLVPARLRGDERAGAPVDGARSGARGWRAAGVVLALGLAGVAARGCVRAGGEVAREPHSSHTGLVAAPLPLESTPATTAPLAVSSQDETSMKAKQRNTPAAPNGPARSETGGNTWRNLCLGAGAASQVLACAGAPVRQAPPPEDCPAGSLTAMTETLGDLFSRGSSYRGRGGPSIRLDKELQPGWMSAPDGPITAELAANWGKLPHSSVLTGKLYVTKDRVYGRFTQVWTPQGASFFICAELWELSGTTEPGLETRQGPRGEIQFFSLAAIRPVRRFD
jgi:serine/threonine-protein kinase